MGDHMAKAREKSQIKHVGNVCHHLSASKCPLLPFLVCPPTHMLTLSRHVAQTSPSLLFSGKASRWELCHWVSALNDRPFTCALQEIQDEDAEDEEDLEGSAAGETGCEVVEDDDNSIDGERLNAEELAELEVEIAASSPRASETGPKLAVRAATSSTNEDHGIWSEAESSDVAAVDTEDMALRPLLGDPPRPVKRPRLGKQG